MTTTDVTKREDGALALPTEGAEGLSGHFGREDIAIPVCSLSQAQSQDKGEQGRYWFPSGESLESLDTVTLDIVATRAMWAPFGSDTPIICRSNDREMGWTDNAIAVLGKAKAKEMALDEGEVAIPCDLCPHEEDARTFTGSTGPKCRYGYTLLLYEINLDTPFLYFVKGTQVKVVKQRIVSPALLRLRRTGKAEPWANGHHWTVRQVIDAKGKYYVPDVMPTEPFGEVDRKLYAEMAVQYAGRASQSTLEENPEGQSAMEMEGAED